MYGGNPYGPTATPSWPSCDSTDCTWGSSVDLYFELGSFATTTTATTVIGEGEEDPAQVAMRESFESFLYGLTPWFEDDQDAIPKFAPKQFEWKRRQSESGLGIKNFHREI